MSDSKMVNFIRFGDAASTMSTVTPADTVRTVIDRIRDDLGLNAKGSYLLINKETNVQITGNVFSQVDDLATVLVAPEESGGGT